MACPPGNCAAWGAFRLCKPLPPIGIDGSYTADELQLRWVCWRARSTGEYGGSVPVDLGFDSPGLIDISKTTNLAQVIAYCESRGTLVQQFTTFSRFGFKFNLPNYKASGSFSTWSGGVFSGATSPGGGGGGDGSTEGQAEGGGGTPPGGGGGCACTPGGGNALTVVVCKELNCDGAAPLFEITVCGGTPPYSWATSGGGGGTPGLTQSGVNNVNAVVTPPDNPAPETAGQAFTFYKFWHVSGTFNQYSRRYRGCDGLPLEGCSAFCHNGCSACVSTPDFDTCRNAPDPSKPVEAVSCGVDNPVVPEATIDVTDLPPNCDVGYLCDKRSAGMVTAGCLPCEIAMEQVVVTVTDDDGTEVSTVIALG